MSGAQPMSAANALAEANALGRACPMSEASYKGDYEYYLSKTGRDHKAI